MFATERLRRAEASSTLRSNSVIPILPEQLDCHARVRCQALSLSGTCITRSIQKKLIFHSQNLCKRSGTAAPLCHPERRAGAGVPGGPDFGPLGWRSEATKHESRDLVLRQYSRFHGTISACARGWL